VRINYYPPRGDNKEGWDNIDIVGWMGYPMQIKVNFLCRDSILAAPLVLDLALFSTSRSARDEGDPGVALVLLQEPTRRPGLQPSTTSSSSRRSSRTRSGTSWARSRSRTSGWSTTRETAASSDG
jgi:myo-inositol-1-phosphate synthase